MWVDVHKKQDEMRKRYISSPRRTIQIDLIEYMDEIGEEMGCKPDIGMLMSVYNHLDNLLHFLERFVCCPRCAIEYLNIKWNCMECKMMITTSTVC